MSAFATVMIGPLAHLGRAIMRCNFARAAIRKGDLNAVGLCPQSLVASGLG